MCELLKDYEATDNIDDTNTPGDNRDNRGGWAPSLARASSHSPPSRINNPPASGLEQFQKILNTIFILPEPII